MNQRIEPRTLQGFRDYLPETMMPREKLMETARRVYRSFGFCPIDTPALELLEVLAGKGSEETDRQIYRFEDNGGRQVGLRFDLTVPLARFAAAHANELGLPFKRYHIAPVWRGERPQAGRFREFMQCDFDTIGTESVAADIETALVIHELLTAINVGEFSLRINNRQVLNGLLDKLHLADKSVPILRALDKLEKVGGDEVAKEMAQTAAVSDQQAREILQFATIKGPADSVLSQLDQLLATNPLGQAGVTRLAELVAALKSCGISETRFQLDVSIARGLDYYTGVIFETVLRDLPSIGSICSGGRYDNLAELYTKQHLPGIGASLGLDRLLAAMETLKLIEPIRAAAPVLVTYFDKQALHDYLKIAAILRAAGIGAEVYPDPKKLGAQLKYADQRGFRAAIIAGSDERARGTCQVKDLRAQTSVEVSWRESGEALIEAVRPTLSAPSQ
ncbi:MAG: histidine--tRNA ligase [Pirellulaceae bacterium]|nr:histidine--tRNA ligase [Pirellulaceae bacterium]